MKEDKKALYVRVSVVLTVILFVVLLILELPIKAISVMFLSGGILGLVTKSIPFYRPPSHPNPNRSIHYGEDSIGGPFMNILFAFVGLITLFMQ